MPNTQTEILVIDNDQDIVRILSMVLGKQGYRVIPAGSADEGLARLSDNVRLIITDLNMPGDGVSLIEKVRETRQMPIIVLTGFHRQYAARLEPLGYITWLAKPIEFQSLLDVVKLELSRSPANSSNHAARGTPVFA